MSEHRDELPVKLGVLHRSRLWRECLASALHDVKPYQALALDHERADYLKRIEDSRPDVVLLDLKLPGRFAVELTHHILNEVGRSKVIALAAADCQDELIQCLAAGAQGCVLEDSSLAEVRRAVQNVYHGEPYCSPALVHSMLRKLADPLSESLCRERAKSVILTPRELEILELIEQHCSNKQIARRLSVSIYTVKSHVHNIVEKLHVGGRYEAVEYARQRRWLRHPRAG